MKKIVNKGSDWDSLIKGNEWHGNSKNGGTWVG